ncbi:MAG: methyltransferase domain-containing protein [Anaerolineae bacterium]|nr:methyltransferase domain-containing protein [Anaerolineae bacterium]
MFSKSAVFYDAIYSFKDYAGECQMIHSLIQQHKRSPGNTLLDVACGTGLHDACLQSDYEIVGIDLDAEMVKIAQQRLPAAAYYQGDMRDFDLGEPFDAVVCLFSSIGYLLSVEDMRQTLRNFYRHTKPGGVMLLEPWLQADKLIAGHVGMINAEQPDLKLTRMTQITRRGVFSDLHMVYMVGKADGITTFEETHHMRLFSHEEYASAVTDAGYTLTYDPQGLMNRGLYIGVRPV